MHARAQYLQVGGEGPSIQINRMPIRLNKLNPPTEVRIVAPNQLIELACRVEPIQLRTKIRSQGERLGIEKLESTGVLIEVADGAKVTVSAAEHRQVK